MNPPHTVVDGAGKQSGAKGDVMSLPKQVQKQIEEVAEIEKQMRLPVADPEPPQVDGSDPGANPPEIPIPETVVKVEIEPPKVVPAVGEDWEHRFKTLSGKYNAEVPNLHQQVKALNTQMKQMELDFKQAEPAQKRPSVVTDDEYETFGEDLLGVTQRQVDAGAAQSDERFKRLEAENSRLREQMQQTEVSVGTMSFEKMLHRTVPDFEAINDNPQWVAWLDQVDPLLRAPRRVVAQQAFDSGDVEAISDYVKLFKQTTAPVKADTSRATLEAQVAPSRTGSTGSGTTTQARTYTSAQAEAVFAKMTSLNMKGRYDEAAKLDAEITTAYTEGRVRN